MSVADRAHHRFLDQLIARGSLWSRPLIDAFRATPRHLFLTHLYHFHREDGAWHERRTDPLNAADLRLIYTDRAVTTRLAEPVTGQQPVSISSSSQPSLMAQMLEDLRLARGQRVLEIGAGTGYNAALLAHVCGEAVSVDVDRVVLAAAAAHLEGVPDRRVVLLHADGRRPVPGRGPFDRIQVTAASPDLEPAWLRQLADGGLVQAPLELAPGLAYLAQGTVRAGRFDGQLTRPAYFMPLRDEDDPGRPGTEPPSTLPDPTRLSSVAPPWAEWSDRKLFNHGPGVIGALAFLAWLEGLSIGYQNLTDGRPAYRVADLVTGHACWLGQGEWRVTGNAGEELGWRLWRAWLDAGGPRPTEYRVCAVPGTDVAAAPPRSAGATLSFVHVAQGTVQRWELVGPRERPALA
jgi:protein-L-isoaspartate(D-aspartate) O-methyltransferase